MIKNKIFEWVNSHQIITGVILFILFANFLNRYNLKKGKLDLILTLLFAYLMIMLVWPYIKQMHFLDYLLNQ